MKPRMSCRIQCLMMAATACGVAAGGPVAGAASGGAPEGLAAGGGALKAPCRGLMSRQGLPPESMPFIDSFVVQVNWNALETADQAFDGPGWQEIEAARKKGGRLRLRVLAGIHAPAFAKRMGPPGLSDPEHGTDCSKTGGVAVWNRHDQKGGATCCFWLPEVLDQYEQLMREIARRYDGAPEIAEVVDSACMTVYAEPFYRAHGERGTNERLWKAGLTFEKDRAAHERAIRIHNAVFQRTRTSLAINAWDMIDDSPAHYRSSWSPAYEFVQWARKEMSAKLVLQNNGFGRDAAPMFAKPPSEGHFGYLAQAAGPKGFQTRTLARLGGTEQDLYFVLDMAVKNGANFVELPSGFQKFSADRLREFDERLERNPLGK